METERETETEREAKRETDREKYTHTRTHTQIERERAAWILFKTRGVVYHLGWRLRRSPRKQRPGGSPEPNASEDEHHTRDPTRACKICR